MAPAARHALLAAPRRAAARAAPAIVASALAVSASLVAGCGSPSYRCRSDNDCDVGPLGRCETTGRCTTRDESCPTLRRYTDYAEELSQTCHGGQIAIASPCAGGQPPALREGCAAAVCEALPACCDTGWSDACAQAAQIRCDVRCDARLAITATRGAATVTYDLRFTGAAWTAQALSYTAAASWLAPAPGTREPRLAGVVGEELIVAGRSYPLRASQVFQTVASVDLDRDGRDVAAVSSTVTAAAPQRHYLEVVRLDDGAVREIALPRSQVLAWGDSDHDAFPDGAVGTGGQLAILDNLPPEEPMPRARSLSAATFLNLAAPALVPGPALRSLEWVDLNGDRTLDLLAIGTQVRTAIGASRIPSVAATRDCDPPVPGGACPDPRAEAATFVGAALPAIDAPAIVVAVIDTGAVYRLTADPAAPAVQLRAACPACVPLLALAARDLDGDRRLDLIGIDAELGVHTGLAAQGYSLRAVAPRPIPPLAPAATFIALSISGAPLDAPP